MTEWWQHSTASADGVFGKDRCPSGPDRRGGAVLAPRGAPPCPAPIS
jgi:hypothetical protein